MTEQRIIQLMWETKEDHRAHQLQIGGLDALFRTVVLLKYYFHPNLSFSH